MPDKVAQDYRVNADERDCSDRQQPRMPKPVTVYFHGFDSLFGMYVVTRSRELKQEQTASLRFPLHRSLQSSSLLRSAVRQDPEN